MLCGIEPSRVCVCVCVCCVLCVCVLCVLCVYVVCVVCVCCVCVCVGGWVHAVGGGVCVQMLSAAHWYTVSKAGTNNVLSNKTHTHKHFTG